MRKAIIIIIFGSLLISNSALAFNPSYRFNDQEKDFESGLYYFDAREYNPVIGKFLQPDPLSMAPSEEYLMDPQQLNQYSYGRNNPLRFVDLTGEQVSEYQPYKPKGATFQKGEAMGEYRGVKLFSAGAQTGSGNHPYQCTGAVKSFIKTQYGLDLSYTGNAIAYADQSRINEQFHKNNPNDQGQFNVYQNNSRVMPQEDDIITWSGGRWGHVGIIAEVTFDDTSGTGYVYTIEQNVRGDGLHYQTLTRGFDEQGNAVYTVGSRLRGYRVQGWTRYQNQDLPDPEEYTSTPYTPAPTTIKNNQ